MLRLFCHKVVRLGIEQTDEFSSDARRILAGCTPRPARSKRIVRYYGSKIRNVSICNLSLVYREALLLKAALLFCKQAVLYRRVKRRPKRGRLT
jgi:hypothetical protein